MCGTFFQANVEMRKRIQKQHSLPAEPQSSRLRERFMAVTRSKQFESLKAGISSWVPKKQPSLPEEPEDSPKPETGEEEGCAKGEGSKGEEHKGKKPFSKQGCYLVIS